MRLNRAARVILVGAPGVGKGTQSERLLSRFAQIQSISSGDLLRHNVKNKTPLGMFKTPPSPPAPSSHHTTRPKGKYKWKLIIC
jgi:hypothetical protein